MQATPRSAFEVIEAEFFLQLLMRLLADPTCFDGSGQAAQVGLVCLRPMPFQQVAALRTQSRPFGDAAAANSVQPALTRTIGQIMILAEN